MSADLPPPCSALTRHPMLVRTDHDETARFNFLAHLNRHLSGTPGPGNRLAYERGVLPEFRAEHGRTQRLNRPDMALDSRFAANAARLANRNQLIALLAELGDDADAVPALRANGTV